MKGPFLRTMYNYDMNEAGDKSGLDCRYDPDTGEETPSMTKQAFAEECDINTIVRKFGLTGQLPQGVRMPSFGDFLDVPDYHSAMNAIREADESFMMMPADIRSRFGNDAGAFVAFCSDPANRVEAEKLGLVAPKAVVEPVGAAAVAGAPSGSSAAPEPDLAVPIKP